MPTDDERREVARRVRFIPKSGKPVSFFVLARQLGLEPHPDFLTGSVYTSESVIRLADLIEPAPERTCRNDLKDSDRRNMWPIPHFKCSSCGGFFASYDFDYCPSCGAKVVDE